MQYNEDQTYSKLFTGALPEKFVMSWQMHLTKFPMLQEAEFIQEWDVMDKLAVVDSEVVAAQLIEHDQICDEIHDLVLYVLTEIFVEEPRWGLFGNFEEVFFFSDDINIHTEEFLGINCYFLSYHNEAKHYWRQWYGGCSRMCSVYVES